MSLFSFKNAYYNYFVKIVCIMLVPNVEKQSNYLIVPMSGISEEIGD